MQRKRSNRFQTSFKNDKKKLFEEKVLIDTFKDYVILKNINFLNIYKIPNILQITEEEFNSYALVCYKPLSNIELKIII